MERQFNFNEFVKFQIRFLHYVLILLNVCVIREIDSF